VTASSTKRCVLGDSQASALAYAASGAFIFTRPASAVVADSFRKVLAGEAEGLLLVLRSSSVTGYAETVGCEFTAI